MKPVTITTLLVAAAAAMIYRKCSPFTHEVYDTVIMRKVRNEGHEEIRYLSMSLGMINSKEEKIIVVMKSLSLKKRFFYSAFSMVRLWA